VINSTRYTILTVGACDRRGRWGIQISVIYELNQKGILYPTLGFALKYYLLTYSMEQSPS
jgi:hypothetical protein